MENHFWPLFDLRIRTPRVEIRLPTDEDLVALAHVAKRGVHDANSMPFLKAWEQDGDLHRYAAGSAGPKAADALLARDGRAWRPLSE